MDFRTPTDYHQDYFGENEKWLKDGENKWYFITETGGLFRWNGRKSATGTLVATFDPSVHADPTLLTEAVRTTVPVSVEVNGSDVTVTRTDGFDSPYVVTVTTTDGQESDSATMVVESVTGAALRLDRELNFKTNGNYWLDWNGQNEKWFRSANDQWYYILPTGSLHVWNHGQEGGHPEVAKLDATFYDNPKLLIDATELNSNYEHQFRVGSNDWFNWGGQQEKWLKGEDNRWFFILPTGDIYRWDGSRTASGTLVTHVDSSYYNNPGRFYYAIDEVFRNWMDLMTF
jgi:hypothetical protein